MEHWTGEQREFAVKSYYLNGQCAKVAREEFRLHCQLRRQDPELSPHAIKIRVRSLEETGSALKKKPPGDNASEMSPESSVESYPAFALNGLRGNSGKNLNQGTPTQCVRELRKVQEIQAIGNRVLQRVASNMERRVELCLMQDGGHFQHLL
ncbi:hypothetical protein ANN_16849 [Periplaneta americana]|uniref:DUF4817 domain-containing protein n=1 Tax=Periplaneta americana TaxID=6978 RepID=A0ABQ8SSR0_PERAM|nr:hypothetical protein ANN_16849 [Periplaneta americana]